MKVGLGAGVLRWLAVGAATDGGCGEIGRAPCFFLFWCFKMIVVAEKMGGLLIFVCALKMMAVAETFGGLLKFRSLGV